jgi:GntR family transcriptional regulator
MGGVLAGGAQGPASGPFQQGVLDVLGDQADQDLMPTWGEDSVVAAVATEDESQSLELEPGAPVLHISRRSFCREVAVEVTRSIYRADRYTLWVPVLRPEHLR